MNTGSREHNHLINITNQFFLQKAPLLMMQSHQLDRVQLLCYESCIDWSTCEYLTMVVVWLK